MKNQTDIPLSEANAIFIKFSNITCFQNFKKAEKIEALEIWQEDLEEKTLILPRYLFTHAIESNYIDSCEMIMHERSMEETSLESELKALEIS